MALKLDPLRLAELKMAMADFEPFVARHNKGVWRYLRLIGGDAVGMSTVPEVIAANHAGMHVLGLSAITNIATGAADQPADSHEEVVAVAKIAGEKLVRLVGGIIATM